MNDQRERCPTCGFMQKFRPASLFIDGCKDPWHQQGMGPAVPADSDYGPRTWDDALKSLQIGPNFIGAAQINPNQQVGVTFPPACPSCGKAMVLHMWDRPGGAPGNGWACTNCKPNMPSAPPDQLKPEATTHKDS
jgi:hypothetical protein